MVELVSYDDGRAVIATLGGIANQADLAHRWGLSRQRVRQMAKEDGFPQPVAVIAGGEVWFAEEADDWRLQHYGRLSPRW